jgi:hypothetical protein
MINTQVRGRFTDLSGAKFEVGDFVLKHGHWYRLDARIQHPVPSAWKQRFAAVDRTGMATVIDIDYHVDYHAYVARAV